MGLTLAVVGVLPDDDRPNGSERREFEGAENICGGRVDRAPLRLAGDNAARDSSRSSASVLARAAVQSAGSGRKASDLPAISMVRLRGSADPN